MASKAENLLAPARHGADQRQSKLHASRWSHFLAILLFCLIASFPAFAQKALKQEQLKQLADKHARASFNAFHELLSLPNDAHFPEDIEKNLVWTEKAFQQRGFKTTRLETATLPLLLAERPAKGARKTALMYLHIDGQPVQPDRWHQKSPWIPALKKQDQEGKWQEIPWENIHGSYDRDWRIFARSASDDKGPAVALLAALDAAAEAGVTPNYNIKVILDFEEEQGSPSLPDAVQKYKQQLAADLMLIFDGPMHDSNRPTLMFGARGIATVSLTTYGPALPQHSGHYGNYAPNPALRMSHLLASMKDPEGRVLIQGWNEGITLSEAEQQAMKAVPDQEDKIRKKLGVGSVDQVGSYYQESLQYPSLNVRGLSSGWVGKEARTIVPATATAELDIRLVPESDPERLMQLLRSHIQQQGYTILIQEPTAEERLQHPRLVSMHAEVSYQAFRTPMNSPTGQWLNKALARAFDETPVNVRMMGGSVPISPFVTTLNIPAVVVPLVNSDNNQHSPNENIRLGNYVDAVRSLLAILTEKQP
ncbi:MAG: M20/M25/M40 family metallo-hydrolase [Bacteroidetes bacterium]|nr:M20/M25/M40 family metallo-hydrolase [Bacteroidota bacterium]